MVGGYRLAPLGADLFVIGVFEVHILLEDGGVCWWCWHELGRVVLDHDCVRFVRGSGTYGLLLKGSVHQVGAQFVAIAARGLIRVLLRGQKRVSR